MPNDFEFSYALVLWSFTTALKDDIKISKLSIISCVAQVKISLYTSLR